MLVTSRSLTEYRAMFGLDERALAGRILDCSAGSSSFVAELVDRGGSGVAVDPAYAAARAELAVAAHRSLTDGDQIIDRHDSRFTWAWYGDPERRRRMRRVATARFLEDIDRRPAHYVAGSLPMLPFAGGAFDLVLCSHLLFTWSNQLDATWHLAAIAELTRVARHEVRVFPLVVQGTGAAVPFLAGLLTRLRDEGHEPEVRRVPYVFQRDADSMLAVRPAVA